jgi:peptide deformylase
MRLRVTKFGEPILREVGVAITEFDDSLHTLADSMLEPMYEAEGIGLAAQQIGQALQICVIDVRPPENANVSFDCSYDGKILPLDCFMPLAITNPRIEITDPQEETYEEGCLSFPAVNGHVNRPAGVRCHFQDLEGVEHVLEANGLLGRCILHEVDHLNGILFIDHMNKRDLKKNETRIKQLKRATRDFLKRK